MSRRARTYGFSVLEVMTALTLVGVGSTAAVHSYQDYLSNTSARRAAEVFASDLALARSTAIRGRQSVSIVFDELRREYVLRTSAGQVITRRSFGQSADLVVHGIDLRLANDSVTFNGRGVADLSAAAALLPQATFTNRTQTYVVSFNAFGATRVAAS